METNFLFKVNNTKMYVFLQTCFFWPYHMLFIDFKVKIQMHKIFYRTNATICERQI